MSKRLLIVVGIIPWMFAAKAYSLEKEVKQFGKYQVIFVKHPDGNLAEIAVYQGKVKILGYRSPEGGDGMVYLDPAVGCPVTTNFSDDNKFVNFSMPRKDGSEAKVISWDKKKGTVKYELVKIPVVTF